MDFSLSYLFIFIFFFLQLFVVASDQGKTPRQSPQIPVTITVLRNQFAPVFTLPVNNQINLKKGSQIGGFVTKVQATDADTNVSITMSVILVQKTETKSFLLSSLQRRLLYKILNFTSKSLANLVFLQIIFDRFKNQLLLKFSLE